MLSVNCLKMGSGIILSVALVVFLSIVIGDNIDKDYFFAALLMGIAVLIYLVSYFKNKDVFSPLGIFSLIWLFSLGLCQLHLSYLQTKWTNWTWLVMICTYLSFLFGVFIAVLLSKNLGIERFLAKQYDQARFKRFITFLFVCCFTAYVIDVVSFGTIPLISKSTSAYQEFGVRFIHYFTVSLPLVNYLIVIYKITYKKLDNSLKLIFIISFIALVTILSRQALIFMIVIILIALNYLTKRIRLSHLFVIVITMALIFTLIGNIRSNSSDYILVVGQMKDSVKSSIFAWLYLYITMNFENVSYYVNNFSYHFWGTNTFFPLIAFAQLKNYFIFDNGAFLPSPLFTTTTFIYSYYLDFGIIGVLTFPFLVGLSTQYIYIYIKKKRTIGVVVLYSFFLHNVIFSYFANFFANPTWVFQITIAVAFIFYLKKTGAYSTNNI